MKVINNKIIFKFTKEDVKALRQLADMIYEECEGAITFSDVMRDVIADPKNEIFDFTLFDTFSIEVEK